MSDYIIKDVTGDYSYAYSGDPQDSLKTDEILKTLHLLGEGVVQLYTGDGQSIFLNNVPLQNGDLSWNFSKVTYEFRSGAASQTPLSVTQFPGASNVFTINTPVLGGVTTGSILTLTGLTGNAGTWADGFYTCPLFGGAGTGAIANITVVNKAISSIAIDNPGAGYVAGNNLQIGYTTAHINVGTPVGSVAPVPVIYNIVSTLTDYVKIVLTFPNGLFKQNTSTGAIDGDTVALAIDTRAAAGPTAWVEYKATTIYDKWSGGQAVLQYLVPRPAIATGAIWDVRVRRVDPDNETDFRKNAFVVSTVEEVESITIPYNGVAYVGINLDALALGGLSTSIPNVSFLMAGTTIKIPDNYDPVTRVYTGLWSGTFSTGVTDNPAWILYDLLTNTNYGCGLYNITTAMVDKYSFYNAGVFNDALVDDGAGGYEPRFTFNAAIQSRQDMLKMLQDVAGVFNAVLGTVNGLITVFQDRPTDSAYAITKSNVIGGGDRSNPYFTYMSSALTSRTTAVNVTWTNSQDIRYLPKTASIVDPTGLSRYGYQSYDLAAFGCTSEGQAIRTGKWWLYTNIHQGETVNFKMGLLGLDVQLYDVFDLYDEDYAQQAGAGRVVSATTNTVTFDQPIVVSGGSPKVSVWQMDGQSYETRDITTGAGTWTTVSISGTWTTIPAKYASYIITSAVAPRTFRVINTKVDGKTKEVDITAQLYDKNNYTYIESGISIPAATYTLPVINKIVDPTNLVFVVNSYVDKYGNVVQGVNVSWTAPVNQVIGYIFKWRYNNGSYNVTPKIPTQSYEIPSVLPGKYDVIVYAVNSTNSVSPGLSGSYTLSVPDGSPSAILTEVTI